MIKSHYSRVKETCIYIRGKKNKLSLFPYYSKLSNFCFCYICFCVVLFFFSIREEESYFCPLLMKHQLIDLDIFLENFGHIQQMLELLYIGKGNTRLINVWMRPICNEWQNRAISNSMMQILWLWLNNYIDLYTYIT